MRGFTPTQHRSPFENQGEDAMSMKLQSRVAPALSKLALVSFAALAGVGAHAATISGAVAGLNELWVRAIDARPDDGVAPYVVSIDPDRATRIFAAASIQVADGSFRYTAPADQVSFVGAGLTSAPAVGAVDQLETIGNAGARATVQQGGIRSQAWTDGLGQHAFADTTLATSASDGIEQGGWFNLQVGPWTRIEAGAEGFAITSSGVGTDRAFASAGAALQTRRGSTQQSIQLAYDSMQAVGTQELRRSLLLDWTNASDTAAEVRLRFATSADVLMAAATDVPEPATLPLLLAAALAAAASQRKRLRH